VFFDQLRSDQLVRVPESIAGMRQGLLAVLSVPLLAQKTQLLTKPLKLIFSFLDP
jgi:hypothetical protein